MEIAAEWHLTSCHQPVSIFCHLLWQLDAQAVPFLIDTKYPYSMDLLSETSKGL